MEDEITGLWLKEVAHAFIDGEHATQQEDHQSDNEGPEVSLHAVAERMPRVGGPREIPEATNFAKAMARLPARAAMMTCVEPFAMDAPFARSPHSVFTGRDVRPLDWEESLVKRAWQRLERRSVRQTRLQDLRSSSTFRPWWGIV
jgi:hypothetical protein